MNTNSKTQAQVKVQQLCAEFQSIISVLVPRFSQRSLPSIHLQMKPQPEPFLEPPPLPEFCSKCRKFTFKCYCEDFDSMQLASGF